MNNMFADMEDSGMVSLRFNHTDEYILSRTHSLTMQGMLEKGRGQPWMQWLGKHKGSRINNYLCLESITYSKIIAIEPSVLLFI